MKNKLPIILISGVPAVGKSAFCERYLGNQKGFLHIDLEKGYLWQKHKQKACLVNALKTYGPKGFVDAVYANGMPTVIDWGFPPICLPTVSELQSSGVEPWWFTGERQLARAKFIIRGGIDVQYYDKQMDDVERHWPDIKEVFNPRIIETLRTDGKYMEPEYIFNIMFPDDAATGTWHGWGRP